MLCYPTPAARPSRKSKEKFQRSLERKRQMGKNIEDYVSDDSEEDKQKQVPKLSSVKQPRRQGSSLMLVHSPVTSQAAISSRRPAQTPVGPVQQCTRQLNATQAKQQKDHGALASGRKGRLPKPPLKRGNRRREGSAAKKNVTAERSDAAADSSVAEASDDGTPIDDEWNSDNDPEKLWCVCRKPHDNQFMIACDECENWFHGKCVGVSKTEGARMERAGHEWFCSICRVQQIS
ncbi:hypothetical protein BIW11_07334 [Tropilaelaps mercedesae]|uniref:PHD-type domain-containing protein n=1 Tax=Tropilaelaps mercedesae TaxID=418985 RepID=A0A1V9XUC5_9ACAR|nr:hypothetical protein BIW11_07334 [Tropilaelaps mercedesae]